MRPYLSRRRRPVESGVPEPVAPRLRPFLLTAGRVRPDEDPLALETQVLTTLIGRNGTRLLSPECCAIVELCAQPKSLAEAAALLGLHLNVVQVLVGDLHTSGCLAVYLPDFEASRDAVTIKRIISALESYC
ncbi:DUF742 domain-containing protein [Streptomyces sp. NPDC054841]